MTYVGGETSTSVPAAVPAVAWGAPGQQQVARNAIRSSVTLLGQGLAVKAVAYVGQVMLSRLLTPQLFGIFGISSYFLTMIRFLADFGLSGAIVQKQGEVTEDDLRTTFTVQLFFMAAGFIILTLAAPFIGQFYHLDRSGVWLIRGMAATVLLAAFRSIAGVRLARQVRLGPISLADGLESVAYWIVAVPMALAGFGIWSFLAGTLAGSAAGTAAIFVIAPYRPRLGFALEPFRALLRFGLPFQGLRVLNILRGSLGPVVLSGFAGATALGYVSWAYTLAGVASFFTASVASPLLLPAFSRLQDDRLALGRAVERAVQLSSLTTYPVLLTLVAIGPLLVKVIYTSKWVPGLPALYIVGAILLVSPISGQVMYQLLLSVGRVRVNTIIFVIATLGEWALGIPLLIRFGMPGMLIGVLIVTYGTGIAWVLAARKVCRFRLLPNVVPYLLSGAIAAGAARTLSLYLPPTLPILVALVGFAAAVYLFTLWLGWRRALLADARYVLDTLRSCVASAPQS